METYDHERLAAEYKRLGGLNCAVGTPDGEYVLNSWSPSTEEADAFWRQNIETLPTDERNAFLMALARHGS